MKKIKEFLKKFFSKKRNIIICLACLLLIIILLIILLRIPKKIKFALNEIYNVNPAEVRELYQNMVEVSCSGDLHFDINLGSGARGTADIDKDNLLEYLFSYLDKNEMLEDTMNLAVFENAAKKLFYGDVNPFDSFKTYSYGNYIYTKSGAKVTRKVHKCERNITYVDHLYGYSMNKENLSMDVAVGYMKDGTLYGYNNIALGKYDGDVTKLPTLMEKATFYRLTYVKENGLYKLTQVEHKNRV